eukprot:6203946-Pleurochrysis_carterae.AAC.1
MLAPTVSCGGELLLHKMNKTECALVPGAGPSARGDCGTISVRSSCNKTFSSTKKPEDEAHCSTWANQDPRAKSATAGS